MELYIFAIKHDWPVLAPILLCSIIALATTIERFRYFARNRSGNAAFIDHFQKAIYRSLPEAKAVADRGKGVIPRLASDAVRLLHDRADGFEACFDARASLSSRELRRGLAYLGTIATICPYLGLFGTVARILLTFGEMAQAQGGSSSTAIMFGIGSALIATAFGLLVAIGAVAMNNLLHAAADEIEADFELIKLVCLSVNPGAGQAAGGNGPFQRLEKAWEI